LHGRDAGRDRGLWLPSRWYNAGGRIKWRGRPSRHHWWATEAEQAIGWVVRKAYAVTLIPAKNPDASVIGITIKEPDMTIGTAGITAREYSNIATLRFSFDFLTVFEE
jgi:hypothetical protein